MTDETTIGHAFIRTRTETRDGQPGALEGRISASGARVLRFDFGTPDGGFTEIAWDDFRHSTTTNWRWNTAIVVADSLLHVTFTVGCGPDRGQICAIS